CSPRHFRCEFVSRRQSWDIVPSRGNCVPNEGACHEDNSMAGPVGFDGGDGGIRIRGGPMFPKPSPFVSLPSFSNGFPSNMGRATAFHCTNFSGVPEIIRIAVRDLDGNLVSNFPATTAHLQTKTFTTHITLVYPATQLNLATGVVLLGTAAIAATSINVVCTAVSIDASLTTLQGYALHGIRFNPPPGSQE